MVIGSDLRALDIPWLLEVDAEKEFAAVPVDARLEDAAPGTPLFEAARSWTRSSPATAASGTPRRPSCCTSSGRISSPSATASSG